MLAILAGRVKLKKKKKKTAIKEEPGEDLGAHLSPGQKMRDR